MCTRVRVVHRPRSTEQRSRCHVMTMQLVLMLSQIDLSVVVFRSEKQRRMFADAFFFFIFLFDFLSKRQPFSSWVAHSPPLRGNAVAQCVNCFDLASLCTLWDANLMRLHTHTSCFTCSFLQCFFLFLILCQSFTWLCLFGVLDMSGFLHARESRLLLHHFHRPKTCDKSLLSDAGEWINPGRASIWVLSVAP